MKSPTLAPAIPSDAVMIAVEPAELAGIETRSPEWNPARALLAGVFTTVRQSVAGWVFLGRELSKLQKARGGRGGSGPARAGLKPWPDLCRSELGISDDTADRCIAAYKVIQHRGKTLLSDDSEEFRVLIAPPGTLSKNEQKRLQDAVGKLLKGDDTQRSLLREFRLIRDSQRHPGGKPPGSKKRFDEVAAEVLTKAYFEAAGNGLERASDRLNLADKSSRKILKNLHITSSEQEQPCLQGVKETLERFIEYMIPDLEKKLEAARQNMKALLMTATELIEEKMQPVAVKRPSKTPDTTKR